MVERGIDIWCLALETIALLQLALFGSEDDGARHGKHGLAGAGSLQDRIPSWGFANTGTRFGKFMQAAAATTLAEKFSDAGMVHQLTGACPTVALHVLWDLPNGLNDVPHVEELSRKRGVNAGSINPNVFQDQEYKYGSLGNPDPAVRQQASIIF